MEVACSADARQGRLRLRGQRGICYTVLLRCAAAAAAQFPPSKQRDSHKPRFARSPHLVDRPSDPDAWLGSDSVPGYQVPVQYLQYGFLQCRRSVKLSVPMGSLYLSTSYANAGLLGGLLATCSIVYGSVPFLLSTCRLLIDILSGSQVPYPSGRSLHVRLRKIPASNIPG